MNRYIYETYVKLEVAHVRSQDQHVVGKVKHGGASVMVRPLH
jgi:hypothetical protein